MSGYVKIGRTTEGTYYAQVRLFNGKTERTHYETPEYITREMAIADANCWKAFHMTDAPKPARQNFDIDEADTVRSLASNGGVPRTRMTGSQFAEWLSTMQCKFPEMTYRVGTEYSKRRTEGEDFFFVIKSHPNARERAFIVKKGNSGGKA